MTGQEIAIVGMGCRFPMADDLAEYWRNILEARVCFSDIPKDRWNHDLFHHPQSRETDKTYVKKVGFIRDVKSFAALHYNMPPVRAKVTDPQQRLLVDCVRAAIQDAGWERRAWNRESTGVFVGASVNEHKDIATARLRLPSLLDGQWGRTTELGAERAAALVEDITPTRAFTIAGNLLNMIAATVAQTFDFGGPAFAIDAACSSALVATVEAIAYLRSGACDVAFACGTYLNLTPDNLIGFSRIGAISRNDSCRPFDAAADGFVLGEGVGAIMLKRLDDALRDGDRIYGVIRGAGINNDGRSEGPMTPRQGGQLAVLGRAYQDSQLPTDTIGFVEAHGTGTAVGDVVEVGALSEHFHAHANGKVDAVISSVKANVGHTMSTAGVAGLMKAALVLHHRTIPPQAAFAEENRELRLAERGFRIARAAEPFEARAGLPRRAAVSSFGFGGTNAHVVLEEAPERRRLFASAEVSRPAPWPFVISAATPALLVSHLAAVADAARGADLADVAFSLAARKLEAARVAFVAATPEELARKLDEAKAVVARGEAVAKGPIKFAPAPRSDEELKVALLFPGQGAQAVGLCKALHERFPAFRHRFDALAAAIEDLLPAPLVDLLYPPAGADLDAATATLTRTEICQPAMAALGLALADFARTLGIAPVATIGHSLGEFVAAGAAGLIRAEDALRFVARRGAIMAALELPDRGAMAAIHADRETARPHVEAVQGVVLANLNAPKQVVASGTTDGIEALLARLASAGIKATRLVVSHAFHSPLMAGAAGEIARVVDELEVLTPSADVISCIRPGVYTPERVKEIFVEHACAPVDFVGGVKAVSATGARLFVQAGAGTVLLSLARAAGGPATAFLTLSSTDDDGGALLCETLAELAVLGVPVELAGLFVGTGARATTLPETPLVKEEYWIASRDKDRPALPAQAPAVAAAPSDGLVELFREQMALLKQQADIIQRQTEVLAGGAKLSDLRAQIHPPVGGDPSAPQPSGANGANGHATHAAKPNGANGHAVHAQAPPPAAPAPRAPSDDDLVDRILGVVAAVSAFPRANVKLEHKLVGDLGFDSLMVVDMAGKIGDAFPGLGGLPKSLFVNDTTIGDLVAYVRKTLGARGAAPAAATLADGSSPATKPISRYEVRLVERPLPARVPGIDAPLPADVVILADRRGVAARLADLLGGARVVDEADATATAVIDLSLLGRSDLDARDAALTALRHARPATRLYAVATDLADHAAVAGFAKALARERADARVKAIVVPSASETAAKAIYNELIATDGAVEVDWSTFGRRVPTLALAPVTAGAPLRPGAVVAISGGTRGLGAKLARELAAKHQAKLILLGRATNPELVDDLRKLGGDAHVAIADVRDRESVAAALAAGRAAFGPIEVVVHAAGLIADAPIGKKSDEDFARVFDTKAAGLDALWRATSNDPLRAFVIYGSWAGRFGNGTQTDYSAANHHVAALAARLAASRHGVRVVTVDLPPWEDSAMVKTIPAPIRAAMRASGVTFLGDREGLDLILAEIAGTGASGEVLVGRDVVEERRDEAVVQVSVAGQPYLGDHRIQGKAVMPLAAALDLVAGAARRVTGESPALADLELHSGIAVADDETLAVRVSARGGEVELHARGQLAYRARLVAPQAIAPLPAPTAREPATLPLATFYDRHIFHGPLMRGVVAIEHLGPWHVEGVVRAASAGELGRAVGAEVDPLLIDSSFQLAAYWAHVRHGRAGLPLGFDLYRQLAPFPPGGKVRCLLQLEQASGDLFVGHIDYRAEDGTLLAQLRGMRAELRQTAAATTVVPAEHYDVTRFPEVLALRQRLELAAAMGISNPYFNVHERVTNDTSIIDGREVINFASYNYLGLSGDPAVNAAVAAAVERYGTSVSASRVASGEKPLHRELEQALARFLGCEDSIVLVGGHATNVSVIGHVVGPEDLILHDSLAHDSIMSGARLSGAKRRPFAHNDWKALDATLAQLRPHARRVLIAVEGTYSMDGDIPPLDRFVEIKKKYGALLLVDEAHSLGVIGKTGRGIGEHLGIRRADVDMWMGTLSKSLASCGGYIAGSHALVEWLKYSAGGFVYSVGLSPSNAAAALEALRQMEQRPELVATLQERARYFLTLCRARGLDTGMSDGSAVIPCIVGNSYDCLMLSQALGRRGINVQPILYPAVEEHLARLRFFVTARHSEEQLRHTADVLAEELGKLNPKYLTKPENRDGRESRDRAL